MCLTSMPAQEQRCQVLGYRYLGVTVHGRDDGAGGADDTVYKHDGIACAKGTKAVVVYDLQDAVILRPVNRLPQFAVINQHEA
ncbi:hypothetical protein MASR2M48_32610 [Spirochaetota bacterium]